MASLSLAVLACSETRQPLADGGAGGDAAVPVGPQLALGSSHTCAIFGGGAVRCWGDNGSGQLGRPPAFDPLAEYSVDLGTDRRATGVYAGQYHTCAILDGGAVRCWGDNTFGQLGLGDMANRGDGVLAMGEGLALVDLGTGERAVSLALGGTATCALLEDGRVKCWGDPYEGATGHGDVEPRGGSPGTMGDNLPAVDLGLRAGARMKVRAIEAFEYHSFCAILDDPEPNTSGLKCWGSNDYCELGLGSHDSGRGAVPGSLGDGLAWIDIGTSASGATRKAVALAGGFQSICVLGDDGVVKCWGTNRSGELGLGTTGDPRSCSPGEMGNAGLVPLPGPAAAISARLEHACALLTTGEATCWGVNTSGQLGTGDMTGRLSPSDPLVFPPGFTPERLVLGDHHSCAVSADRRATCWGSDQQGQLGPPAAGDRVAPGSYLRLRGAAIDTVAAGGDHACAILAGGVLKCWGRNAEGQLGVGDTINRGDGPNQMGDFLPAVAVEAGATAVAAGAAHTCAVLVGGAVTCWGAGDAGQLGAGATSSVSKPSPALVLPGVATAVAAGADFSCALLADGRVYCWGGGARGQLGSGDRLARSQPGPAVSLPGRATAIVAGNGHACARLQSQALACWGANDVGQLGVGDREDGVRPVTVPLGERHVVSAASQADSTCVLLDDHGVRCWGGNARGQLGLGDAQDRVVPPPTAIDLGRGRQVSAITVGGAFACALLDTHQAKCWGDNQGNQLGAPLRAPAYGDQADEMGDFLAAAVQGGGRGVKAIAAGRAHACAILDTADVRCWGDNSYGQLGAGDSDVHSLFLHPTGVLDLGGGP